nr:MAG TPA: hypothetical protein [Caudoviricetes sp.]
MLSQLLCDILLVWKVARAYFLHRCHRFDTPTVSGALVQLPFMPFTGTTWIFFFSFVKSFAQVYFLPR